MSNTSEVYRIYYHGSKPADYLTLEKASAVANEIAEKTGIIVGIEKIEKSKENC